jgi:hypothetical protein
MLSTRDDNDYEIPLGQAFGPTLSNILLLSVVMSKVYYSTIEEFVALMRNICVAKIQQRLCL